MKNPAADFRLSDEKLDNVVDAMRNEAVRWNANGNTLRATAVQWCIDQLSNARMDANAKRTAKLIAKAIRNHQLGI